MRIVCTTHVVLCFPVVCRRTHVLITLFVFACVWWCPSHVVLCFPVVCRRTHVLFTLFVFARV